MPHVAQTISWPSGIGTIIYRVCVIKVCSTESPVDCRDGVRIFSPQFIPMWAINCRSCGSSATSSDQFSGLNIQLNMAVLTCSANRSSCGLVPEFYVQSENLSGRFSWRGECVTEDDMKISCGLVDVRAFSVNP